MAEAKLTLKDGREFNLVLDFEAMIEAETAYRRPLHQLFADGKAGFVGAVRAILFGALRAKHPTMTPHDAGLILKTDMEAVMAALESVQPEDAPIVDKPAAKPKGKGKGKS